MSDKPECSNWDSSCHLLDNETSKKCAEAKGVKCYNFRGWEYHPKSPWGAIWICPHGCTKYNYELKDKVCMYCDGEK